MKTKDSSDIITFMRKKDYEMINDRLGSGSFGKTVLLRDPFIDELFVAKKYEPQYEGYEKEFYDSFLQEIKIMYKLNHKNIVRIYNYYPYETRYTGYILMEYIEGKRIDEYLSDSSFCSNDINPDNIFSQLIDGFSYMEKQGIVHRDIREGNILVTKDGIVKIIDFGLGKIFSPLKGISNDSKVDIINRQGLDKLPNEHTTGKYDSQTDMFYLAELYNRLLEKKNLYYRFSYKQIIQKMMEQEKSNRYTSFNEIKNIIDKKDFYSLEISSKDKSIYQEFSNAIFKCLQYFIDNTAFVVDIDEFKNNLHSVILRNCFEDSVQNTCDIVKIVVKSGFRYNPNSVIRCSTLKLFEEWYNSLSKDSQQLVLNNIIAKLSVIRVEFSNEELPF